MEDQTLLQDLMELATHMRQERLFTQYELNNLQTLNEQVNINYCNIIRIHSSPVRYLSHKDFCSYILFN